MGLIPGLDHYDRMARVYPALLFALPFILLVPLLFQALATLSERAIICALIAALIFWLANVARQRGKMLEPRVIERNGGWPSTQMLRHRDARIDAYTKSRYFQELAKSCPDIKLPTVEQEEADPVDADNLYRSVTKRLMELRRGKAYWLILHENAAYGFRRNMLGLKMPSIAVLTVLAALELVFWLLSGQGVISTTGGTIALHAAGWSLPILAVINVLLIFAWSFGVSDSYVLQGANSYAEALLRSLDGGAEAEKPRAKRQRNSTQKNPDEIG
jgi:hypothetical protein